MFIPAVKSKIDNSPSSGQKWHGNESFNTTAKCSRPCFYNIIYTSLAIDWLCSVILFIVVYLLHNENDGEPTCIIHELVHCCGLVKKPLSYIVYALDWLHLRIKFSEWHIFRLLNNGHNCGNVRSCRFKLLRLWEEKEQANVVCTLKQAEMPHSVHSHLN